MLKNWRDAGEKNEVTDVREFPIVFKAPEHRQKITTSPDYETKSQGSSEGKESTETDGNWTITTKSFSYSSKAENGIDSFTNTYEYSSSSVVYKKGEIELQFDYGTWTIEEDETTISDPRDVTYNEVVYDGYDYVNKVNWTYTIAADENVRRESKTSNSAKAEVLLLIEKDKLVKKEGTNVQHEIVDENTDKFTWDEVETWSHGEQKTTPKEWIRHRHFKARERQSVYTNNKEYTTGAGTTQMIQEKESDEGNMHVTTRYMRYTAKSDNGDKPFDNVYEYDYQKGVYTDKDNKYTLTFDFPTWTIEENGTNVSATPQRDGDYAVWVHTHNVKHNYVVTYEGISNSKAGEAKALTDIYLFDIPKNLPDEWGDVVGMQVTYVPARDVNGHYPKLAFCLRTTKGAVSTVIDRSRELPTIEEITKAYFVEGEFGAEYNSAFYTTQTNRNGLQVGRWAPAVGKDKSGGVHYYYKDRNVDNVRSTDLSTWGSWHSVYVEGYSSTLENGVLVFKTPSGAVLKLH